MAALQTTYGTLLDIAKSLDPDGKTADVVEMLKLEVPILDHMMWEQGNLETGMRHVIRSGLPSGTWRKLYQGVQPSKSTKVPVTDNCGTLEAYTEVDKKLIDLAGANGSSYRFDEDKAQVMGLGHQVATQLIYGNEGTEPAAFTGLAPRYNSLAAENADNIISAGGSGTDNMSAWLVCWGKKRVHGIYPKNTKAGLQQRDLGEDTAKDADGGLYQVMRSHFTWDCGLALCDWRYAVRVCNIDRSNLTKDASGSSADLVDLCMDAMERPPSLEGAVWYGNRTFRSFMRRQMVNHKNVNLSFETVMGKRVMMIGEVPLYRLDSLLNTEAAVA